MTDRKPNAHNENGDRLDPATLAHLARIWRIALARSAAIEHRACPICRAEPGQDCHPVGDYMRIGDYPGRPYHSERERSA